MKLRSVFVSGTLFSAATTSCFAHDAWIELQSPANPAAMEKQIEFFIGHAEDRTHYAADAARISTFFAQSDDGIDNLLPLMKDYTGKAPIALSHSPDQASVIILNTFRARSELEAEAFNNYVIEEGISPIMELRGQSGDLNKPGVEVYSRFLKALDIPAEAGCELGMLAEPVGQVLEIIPVTHPGKACETDLAFELLYFGEPVEGATLHLNRTDETVEPIKAVTDENGHARFEKPTDGMWYVHAAWAMPVSRDRFDADFATSFASVSFNMGTD